MYNIVTKIVHDKLLGTGTDIPLLIPIRPENSIDLSEETIYSNIELPAIIKQHILDILLDDIGSFPTLKFLSNSLYRIEY